MSKIYLFGTKEIKDLLVRVLEKNNWQDKNVLDFPAGTGFTSGYLLDCGAKVTAIDIFPEFFKEKRVSCLSGDLQKEFSFAENTFDAAIFQEGIEHLPHQLLALKEFARVLKGGGKLYLTTPNYSNLRSRLAYFLFEAETPKMLPPNEIESVWYSKNSHVYYGHIFSTGIMRLRLLGHLAGLRLENIHPSRVNISSLLLALFLWPILVINSLLVFQRALRKNKERGIKVKKVFMDLLLLNFHPSILLGGHLIVEFTKESMVASVNPRESKIIYT